MDMYDHLVNGTSENIQIMGYPFFAEDIEAHEPDNRRERKWTPIFNGTEEVTKGEYVHREYSFMSLVSFPPGQPEVHDKIFKKMVSKPVEVISPAMGGKFNAIITMRRSFPYPNRMKLDVTVTEVPDKKSLIPGESSLVVPTTKKIKQNKVNVTTKKDSKNKNQITKLNSKRNYISKKIKGVNNGYFY